MRVNITFSQLQKFFETYGDRAFTAISNSFKESGKQIVKDARSNHRYVHRTHKLEKATQMITFGKKKRNVRVWINPRELIVGKERWNYGKRIHDGTSRWRKDPFLTKSLLANKRLIKFNMIKRLRALRF